LTAGEIFAVAARSSDSYRFIPLLWAALATLIGGTLAAFAWPLVSGTVSQGWGENAAGVSAQALALGQIAVFVCLALLTLVPAVRLALVPKPVQFARCRRHATEQFLAHNLHVTEARTGVLIFVSMAERFATILADEGIAEHVDDAVWAEIVEDLIARITEGDLAGGFEAAIAACGAVLAEHVPPGVMSENELPDRLVEI
ncbi:MAG: TPM domain-containing protein, partial [Pseudomonadota bacterium]